MDLSSPFVNIHSFRNTLDSRFDLQIANGLLFIVMFACCPLLQGFHLTSVIPRELWTALICAGVDLDGVEVLNHSPSERSLMLLKHPVPWWLAIVIFNRQWQLFTSLNAFPFTTIDCLNYNHNYTKTPDTSEKNKILVAHCYFCRQYLYMTLFEESLHTLLMYISLHSRVSRISLYPLPFSVVYNSTVLLSPPSPENPQMTTYLV